jgi:glycosyltransferase involved in cell wall biosynthesis
MAARPLRVLELRTVRGTGGGPDKTILQGTALTDRERYDVTICYIRDARDTVFDIDRRARQLPVRYVEVIEQHSLDRQIWPALRKLVRDLQIEIVHGHDYKTNLLTLLLARAEGIIAVSTAHGWVGTGRRERLLYFPLDRVQQRFFSHVVAVSSDVRDSIVAYGADPARVSVVLNGVDPNQFRRVPGRRAESRALFDLPADAMVIGSVGRLEQEKNYGLLIGAFARVHAKVGHAVLVIAGDGRQRALLGQQAASLGLSGHVRLLGLIDNVATLHHALDVYVQSSDAEGTANSVLEALALETPLVATDVGGTTEVARHGREALIVAKGDEDGIVEAILQVIRDPDAAALRARNGRVRVETELSFARRTQRIESIYDHVAREAGLRMPASVHA